MINYSSDKYDTQETTVPDGEYKALIIKAEFTPDFQTKKKGKADVFSLELQLKSGPSIGQSIYVQRYAFPDDDKSAKTCTYFFSSLAKLGIDVNSFRKRNDMLGLMDACLNKWVTVSAKTNGEYQNFNIKGKAANIPVPTGNASDGLNFTQDMTTPDSSGYKEYTGYRQYDDRPDDPDEVPF